MRASSIETRKKKRFNMIETDVKLDQIDCSVRLLGTENRTDWLVKAGNATVLASGMREVSNLQFNRLLTKKENCFRKAGFYSSEKVLTSYEEVYDQLLYEF